jgi:hypothetical protein
MSAATREPWFPVSGPREEPSVGVEVRLFGPGDAGSGGREETGVPKQRPGRWRGEARTGEAAPLPDLTGVGLHALRDLDEPMLLAAVDEVLCSPGQFSESWRGEDGGEGGKVPPTPPSSAAK